MINPFDKLTRSQTLPSGTNFSPFSISNGVLMPNGTWTSATTALQNSDIYTVISRISSDIALMKWNVSDNFKSLLETPNNLINGYSFWQSVVAQMLLSGNAYVILSKNRLELVPTHKVQVVLGDNSANLSYTVNFDDGRPDTIYSADEMLHFRCFASGVGTDSQYVGVSPLMSLVSELNIQDYSKKLTLSTLKSAINPSVVITVPDAILDKEAKNNIRTSFEDQNSGDNAGRVMVLDQSAKLSQISINTDVANFLNNANFSQTQIAKAFGISDSYLNGAGDAQSSIQMVQGMYLSSLQTYIQSITSELQLKLHVPVGLDISTISDPTNQQFIENVVKLSTGKTPVLTPEQVTQILTKKGVLGFGNN